MVGSSSLRRSSSYDFLPPDLFGGDPNMEAKREQQLKTMVQMMENVKRLRTVMFPGNSDNYKEEIKTALQSQKKFNKVRLNVAVTGEAGSGESTLVNAPRIFLYGTEGAAPTGVQVTTMKPKEYINPQNRNITVWDLPGIGTTKFSADKYKERVEFEKYDFFIIVSNHRFKENDAKLAKEIHKMKKKFYFVRSKIDQDIKNEKANDPDFNEENLLKSIRDDCTEELQKLGFKSPKVFLVSGLRLHLYQFKDLWKTLKEDLPELQKDALLLALPNISLDVLQQKKGSLASKIKWFSAVSAAGLIPGLSGAFDPGIIMGFTHHCRISLGLTPEELKRLSDVSGVSLEDLRAELKSQC